MNVLNPAKKKLLIGIGNDGRADDALGWKFAEAFSLHQELFDVEYRYQLQIEDALLVTEYAEVIFADASHKELIEGFELYECKPQRIDNFTSHSIQPETILWLAQSLYNQSPKGYVMAISGNAWELKRVLSSSAEQNLGKAIAYFNSFLKQESWV